MVTIDVVHDTVCPWCRVGKKNLDDALAAWRVESSADPGEPAVRWHPFLLQPGLPDEGEDFRGHMAAIKGPAAVDPMVRAVTQAGARVGVTFRFDRVTRAPNSLASHALIAAAPADRAGDVVDALHRAYFEDGVDIGDRAELAALAAAHGVDPAAPSDPALLEDVRRRAEAARAQGVSGVPLFILDGRLALSGAQPPDVLVAALRRAAATEV